MLLLGPAGEGGLVPGRCEAKEPRGKKRSLRGQEEAEREGSVPQGGEADEGGRRRGDGGSVRWRGGVGDCVLGWVGGAAACAADCGGSAAAASCCFVLLALLVRSQWHPASCSEREVFFFLSGYARRPPSRTTLLLIVSVVVLVRSQPGATQAQEGGCGLFCRSRPQQLQQHLSSNAAVQRARRLWGKWTSKVRERR